MLHPAISLVFTPAWVLWSIYVTWFITGDHEPAKGMVFCILFYTANWLLIFQRTDMENGKQLFFFLLSVGVFVLAYFFCAFHLRAFDENIGFGSPYTDDWLKKINNSNQVLAAMAITASAALFSSAAMHYPVRHLGNYMEEITPTGTWTKDQIIAIIGVLVSLVGVVISYISLHSQR
jgi:hypothetical protein